MYYFAQKILWIKKLGFLCVCLCHNLFVYRIVKSSRSWTPGSSRLWMVLTLFRLCWRKSWADSTEPKPQHESTRSRPLPGNWKKQERQQVNCWLDICILLFSVVHLYNSGNPNPFCVSAKLAKPSTKQKEPFFWWVMCYTVCPKF